MSEDKQLTVAELLARAGGNPNDKPGEGQARPRRRRSLEEGGVSVAELTGSIKKVEARPAEVKHSNVPIDAPAAPSRPAAEAATPAPVTVVEPASKPAASKPVAPKPAAAKADETAVIRKVRDTPTTPATPSAGATSGSSRISSPATASTADTGVIPAVEAEEPRLATPAVADGQTVRAETAEDTGHLDRVDDAVDTRGHDEVDEAAEDDSALNPILLVLLVFAGVVVGILGFLAFQWVWAHLKTVVAALLALAAVLAVVFGVRSMRTGRDTLTTVLAGVAGVVMAFGPALIV